MKQLLSLKVGDTTINAPGDVPTGGLAMGETIIRNGITIFIVLGAVLAVIMFVWGGITWITSEGDKAKLDAARKRLIFAVVGLIVVFFSFGIINLISFALGVDIF